MYLGIIQCDCRLDLQGKRVFFRGKEVNVILKRDEKSMEIRCILIFVMKNG